MTTSKGFVVVSAMIRLIIFLCCCFTVPNIFADAKIVVLGDSISASYGIKQEQSWVALLQQRLRDKDYPYQTINASISGDTTSGGLQRIDKVLANHSPAIVIVELGGNDGLRGLSLKTIRQNLLDIITKCEQKNVKVLLAGMQLPPNYGVAYTNGFSRIFTSLSAEKNIPLVPFILQGIESDMRYFQEDRIHPNAKAQIVLLDNVWPILEPML